MKTKNLITGVFFTISLSVMVAIQSCHNRYDEGSEEGHYDTVQPRTNDHSMSNQQHDGLKPVPADLSAHADSATGRWR